MLPKFKFSVGFANLSFWKSLQVHLAASYIIGISWSDTRQIEATVRQWLASPLIFTEITINLSVVYMGRYEVVLRGDYP
jgi:hypothetical protein